MDKQPFTAEEVYTLMKERGYESVAHSPGPDGSPISIVFIKRINDELAIDAKVSLKQQWVSLYITGLKYFCQLGCPQFAIDHKEFDKFEQVTTMYGAKCLELDVFQILAGLKKTEGIKEEESDVAKKEKKDIAKRKLAFWEEIRPFARERKWSKEKAVNFYSYWTETTKGGKRFRRENETYFDIKKRMATFDRFDNEKVEQKKSFIDKKVEQQNKEIKTKTTVKKEDLF